MLRVGVLGEQFVTLPCLTKHINVGTCGTVEEVVAVVALVLERLLNEFVGQSLHLCLSYTFLYFKETVQSNHSDNI